MRKYQPHNAIHIADNYIPGLPARHADNLERLTVYVTIAQAELDAIADMDHPDIEDTYNRIAGGLNVLRGELYDGCKREAGDESEFGRDEIEGLVWATVTHHVEHMTFV